MAFALYTTPTARRALKKLPQAVKDHLLQSLQVLCTEPQAGQPLQGKLSRLHSYHTRYKNTDYRVAYEIKAKDQAIVIWYAASRENFYRQLEQLF